MPEQQNRNDMGAKNAQKRKINLRLSDKDDFDGSDHKTRRQTKQKQEP